jgi:hypothetical protein
MEYLFRVVFMDGGVYEQAPDDHSVYGHPTAGGDVVELSQQSPVLKIGLISEEDEYWVHLNDPELAPGQFSWGDLLLSEPMPLENKYYGRLYPKYYRTRKFDLAGAMEISGGDIVAYNIGYEGEIDGEWKLVSLPVIPNGCKSKIQHSSG